MCQRNAFARNFGHFVPITFAFKYNVSIYVELNLLKGAVGKGYVLPTLLTWCMNIPME